MLTTATVSRIFTPDPQAGYHSLPDWTYYETLLRLLGADPDDYQKRWERAQHEWQNHPRPSTRTRTTKLQRSRPTTEVPNSSDLISPALAAAAPAPSAVGYFRARGRRHRQQLLVLLVFTGVLLTGATAVTTWITSRAGSSPTGATVGHARSESCQRDHRNLDSGRGTVRVPALTYRTGPALDCPALGHVPAGTLIYYQCSVATNREIWTYGRARGTHEQGWFQYHDLGQDQQLAPC